jgi:hypothetical protein
MSRYIELKKALRGSLDEYIEGLEKYASFEGYKIERVSPIDESEIVLRAKPYDGVRAEMVQGPTRYFRLKLSEMK